MFWPIISLKVPFMALQFHLYRIADFVVHFNYTHLKVLIFPPGAVCFTNLPRLGSKHGSCELCIWVPAGTDLPELCHSRRQQEKVQKGHRRVSFGRNNNWYDLTFDKICKFTCTKFYPNNTSVVKFIRFSCISLAYLSEACTCTVY